MAMEKWVNAQLVLDGFFYWPWPSLTPPLTAVLSAEGGSVAISGSVAFLFRGLGLACEGGSVAVSGSSAGLSRTWRLSLDAGAFAVSGTAAGLSWGRRLQVDSGAFELSGGAAGLRRGLLLSLGSGAFTVAGGEAWLIFGDVLPAYPGSVSITGAPTSLLFNRKTQAGTASITITSQPAGLYRGYVILPQAGSFIISGQPDSFLFSRVLQAAPSDFVIAGNAASLLDKRIFHVDSGQITLTGQDVFIGNNKGVVVNSGSILITGFPISFDRIYILDASHPFHIHITDTERTSFKHQAAVTTPPVPSSTSGPRGAGSSMSSRETSSVSNRTVSDSLVSRTQVASIDRRPAAVACPVGATIVRYVDKYIYVDGSMTTATVFEMPFSYVDATPQAVFALAAGAVIAEVNVWMLEAFDGVGASINIGRAADHDELMDDTEIDPSFLSSYATRPGAEYGIGESVNLYLNPGAGATHGRGVLSIYII